MNIKLYHKKILIFVVLNKFKFYQNQQNVFLKFNHLFRLGLNGFANPMRDPKTEEFKVGYPISRTSKGHGKETLKTY